MNYRKLLKPFLIIVGIVVLNFFNIVTVVSDTCSGGISEFEDRHCGMEGRIPGSAANYSTGNDILLEPVSFLVATVIARTTVYEDSQLSFHNNFSEAINRVSGTKHIFADTLYFVATPWFTYDFFTYQETPNLVRNILPSIVWLLNIPYWLGLAWVGNYLWNKNKYTKIIVLIFLIDKTVCTVGILLISLLIDSLFYIKVL